MSAPLSAALRTRFQKLIEEGLSGARGGVASEGVTCHWRTTDTSGEDQRPCGTDAPRAATRQGKGAPHQAFLEKLVAQDPEITHFELRDALADAEAVLAAAKARGVRLGVIFPAQRYSLLGQQLRKTIEFRQARLPSGMSYIHQCLVSSPG